MHRFLTATMVVVLVASLLMPFGTLQASDECELSIFDLDHLLPGGGRTNLRAVDFEDPIDTSSAVAEYPLVSRALMLPGGSTDAVLADVNGDNREDLVVAVSGSNGQLSVFYGQVGGEYLTYPSYSISLGQNPIAICAIDVYASGKDQIAVLEKRDSPYGSDRLVIINVTDESSHEELRNLTLYDNAVSMVVGDFVGDNRPDIAVACAGPEPVTSPGVVEVRQGPAFSTYSAFATGNGTNAITASDFNSDFLVDIAVCNYYDKTVLMFHQPFSLGMVPSIILNVDGHPTALTAGRLNSDSSDDLVVCTEDPPSAHFYYQSLGELPVTEDYDCPLDAVPSHVQPGDLNGDGLDDLLVLSAESNTSLVMLQRETVPIWAGPADHIFPTGAFPRGSVIGHFNSDEDVDIAIASAGDDWNGSSIALYLSGPENYSNSNATIWTKADYEAFAIGSGDIDGDDFEDMIFLYDDHDAFGYKLSSSETLFTISLSRQPYRLIVADLNADGFADILITDADGESFTIHFGDAEGPGLGVFSTWTGQCSGRITDAAVGDLNNDTLLDIALATDEGIIEVFFSHGPGLPFDDSLELAALPGAPLASLVVGDFNADGLTDLAYPRPTRTISVILQGEGPTPLSLPADYDLTASFDGEYGSVLSGDITGDGRDDIMGLRAEDDRAYLFDQTEFDTTSLPFDTLVFPEVPAFVALTDATDDGFDDVIAIFDSADLVFLYRQEDGSLPKTPSMTFVTGASPSSVVIADGTKDHRGDLVVCDSGSHSISVWEQLNFAPVAHPGGPYMSQQGDPLVFDGSTTTGLSEVPFMEYRWDFGDGNATDWIREPNPVHTYMQLDVFDVKMEARDPLGLSDNASTTVTVVDSSPHVSFTMFPLVPREGDTIQFNDTTTSYDPVVLLNWTVDGAAVIGDALDSIMVTFDDGPHSVSLEALDSDGSLSDCTLDFLVLSKDPDAFLVAPSIAEEGIAVSFRVDVDPWNGGPWDDVVSYEWNFSYEGGDFVADVVTLDNSTCRVFGADGDSQEYSIAVRVTDEDGDSTMRVVNITILDIGPDASLTLSDDTPGEGIPFSFFATDSYDGVVDWAWVIVGPDGYNEEFNLTADAMAVVDFVLPDGSYTVQLEIAEADGDTDLFTLDFEVAELPPSVALYTLPDDETFFEFEEVGLLALVESYDDVVGFEWDFIAYGGEFIPDESTVEGTTHHRYNWTGNYTTKVRVTDSEGSYSIAMAMIDVVDRELYGTFDDIIVTRDNPDETSTMTFDASYFAETFPDISNAVWEFGDGAHELLVGSPSQPISHSYLPVRNYRANLTLTDDDGNVHSMSQELLLIQPFIEMISPSGNNVINPGAPIRFLIGDDSLPLVSVTYSIDGGEEQDFTSQYEVDTTDWADDVYLVTVRAEDRDGNIAILRDLCITIDSEAPAITLFLQSNRTYSGDRLNITIEVNDANVNPGGVTLFTRFPGDESPSSTVMKPLDNGRFYAVVHVPMRTGTLEFWITAEDMAGNSVTSETFTMAIEMHFIDAAWPYLLALAVLAAFGTAAYFVRETKTAVDETFVIYHDGRLMAHSTRRLKPGMDDQVLGSMFVAIQDFVMDSFKDETSFTLRKLDFGEKSVLVERGDRIFLAAVLHGRSSRKVVNRMKKVVGEIEKHFESSLVAWDGNLDEVRGVNDVMKKLYSRVPAFPGTQKRS